MNGRNAITRWTPVLAVVGAILLLLGAYWIRRAALPHHDIVIDGRDCHTPVTILDPPPGVSPVGSAIVLHGLSADRRVMTYLGSDFAGHGFRTYLFDLAGHGDNTDAFTFPRAEQCAAVAIDSLTRSAAIDPRKTILFGHSMGGEIAVRMADHDPVAATIALSPAPMTLPLRMPSNLLVIAGGLDLWPVKREAQALAAAAGGDRTAPTDFAEQRAFQLVMLPYATHTTGLLDRHVAHRSELWAMRALFPGVPPATLALNLDLATYQTFDRGRHRLAGAILGLIGLALLFPLALEISSKLAGPPQQHLSPARPSRALAAAEGAVGALAAVLVLSLGLPLRFLHLYAGSYLASLLLIDGVFLLALNWKAAKESWSVHVRPILASALLGFAVFLATGAWLNWQLADMWMNAPRWLRFAELLPIGFVVCFAEEVVLGAVEGGQRRALRYFIALVLRLELWLACLLAYYRLANGEVLILILFFGLAGFSLLQRLATDALRVRTGSAIGAALFGAILAAWFVAAIFPLT
ncbi:MAG TPA: alpha/beta fold hydrolase [Candidatus Baltobacteraceae bacterium]|nr:alpha/beta fold hydrolase [Candidatus Baltobacteraceae bacterium]